MMGMFDELRGTAPDLSGTRAGSAASGRRLSSHAVEGLPGSIEVTTTPVGPDGASMSTSRWRTSDPGLQGLVGPVNTAVRLLSDSVASQGYGNSITVPPAQFQAALQTGLHRGGSEAESDFEANRDRMQADGLIEPGESMAGVYERISLGVLTDRWVRPGLSELAVSASGSSVAAVPIDAVSSSARFKKQMSVRTANAVADYRASGLGVSLDPQRAPAAAPGSASVADRLQKAVNDITVPKDREQQLS